MKKVLLVGSGGNLGSILVNNFNQKFELTTVSKNNYNANLNIDLLDKAKVESFSNKFIKYDTMIFLVGLAHKKGKNKDFSKFQELNYFTLLNLMNALKKHDKVPSKIIFSSTISVYGEDYEKSFFYENCQPGPKSPYAKTKLQAEIYLKNYFPNNSWILRLAPVYSENFNINLERRTGIMGIKYKVGNGNNRLSLCSAENISIVIEQIIRGNIPKGTYNISDDKAYTYQDILKTNGVRYTIRFPKSIIYFFYILFRVLRLSAFEEKLNKLISDNIYPPDKIKKFVKIPFKLKQYDPKIN